jgi:hypothetical protein
MCVASRVLTDVKIALSRRADSVFDSHSLTAPKRQVADRTF